MTALSWWAYLAAFAASVALAWALTPLMLRLAVRRGALDMPGAHKSHASPVPYLGGVAIVVAFALAIIIASLLYRPPSGLDVLALVLVVAVALSLLGLIDDLRGISPVVKIIFEVGAGVVVWAVGAGVTILPSDALNLLVTVLWVVGITNAFNLLDNMDGLSAGLAFIAAGTFFLLAALQGQFLVAALSAAVGGCALGFLRHNFHPARIYMGDAGSLFLGFLLAFIGIRLRLDHSPPLIAALVPVLVLGVAVFDMVLVVVNRLRHRRSPLVGARDHTSHRLVFVGIPVPAAVALIYAGAVAMSWLALVLSRLDLLTGLLLIGFVAAVASFFLVLLSAAPVYENSRRRNTMLRLVQEHEPAHGSAGADAAGEVLSR